MVSDTNPEVEAMRVKIWRKMSISDKFAIVARLNHDLSRLAEVDVRRRYPDATDREVFLRVAARRNGRDLSVAAYGWDPNVEGW